MTRIFRSEIDVEGSELLVMQGAKDTIERCRSRKIHRFLPVVDNGYVRDPEALQDSIEDLLVDFIVIHNQYFQISWWILCSEFLCQFGR